MKKKLDLIGFVGAILLIIAFVITLSITFLCDIDLSKYTTKDYVDYQIENHTHPKVTNEDIEQIMNDIF